LSSGGLPVTDENLGGLLEALPEKAFCHRCLTAMVGEPIDPLPAFTKRLNVVDGFTMKIAACSACDQECPVFGYSPVPKLP
jgi:hypothetical protein